MTTTQNVSELQMAVLWFLDLPEVPAVYKMELIEYMQETDEISLEVLVYINAVLEENVSIQNQKLQQLEHVKQLLEDLSALEKNEETSMRVALVKEAESFLQDVSTKFSSDWNNFVRSKDVEAEKAEHAQEEEWVQSLRGKLTK